METQFSYFKKPITNITPTATVSLAGVYHLLRGDSFEKQTLKLRTITHPKEARRYKAKNFDYVTFSGTFSQRNEASLVRHSGFLALDFDHLEDVQAMKQLLLADLCLQTQLLFVSPSGNGLKWIIRADLSKLTHAAYFTAVTNYLSHTYGFRPDASGKDVSRACFLCHDPEAYIHGSYLNEEDTELHSVQR